MADQATFPHLMPGAAILRPGDTIAEKYLIDSVLGVGGMGVVYLARHLQLGGRVALKFLSAECLQSPQAIERFRREAQAAAKLSSEHVVRVFDVGTHTSGLPYMVMEYLEGRDLSRLLEDSGPLPIDVTASLLIQTCSALEDAHRHGIIHRDLKPSNLFCVQRSDGTLTIKVVDFGISKVTGEAAHLEGGITVTGHIIGSPSYMSPEQMKTPNAIDQRSDIWQLGVVLYECLTGKLPFPGGSYAEICLKVHQEPPVSPRTLGVELPSALEAVIEKCLAKEPAQRYSNASELAAALWEFAPHLPRTTAPSFQLGDARGKATIEGSHPAPSGASSKLRGPTGTQPGWVQSTAMANARLRLSLVLGGLAMAVAAAVAWGLFRSHPDNPPRATAVASVPLQSAAPAAALASATELEQPSVSKLEQPSVSELEQPSVSELEQSRPSRKAADAEQRLGKRSGTSVPKARVPQLAPSVVAPQSSAEPAGQRSPPKESKPSTKTTPLRPATERDPKSSIWTR